MADLRIRTARQRLSAADLMRELSDATLLLAGKMDRPARSQHESEERIAEAERISIAVRKVVRG